MRSYAQSPEALVQNSTFAGRHGRFQRGRPQLGCVAVGCDHRAWLVACSTSQTIMLCKPYPGPRLHWPCRTFFPAVDVGWARRSGSSQKKRILILRAMLSFFDVVVVQNDSWWGNDAAAWRRQPASHFHSCTCPLVNVLSSFPTREKSRYQVMPSEAVKAEPHRLFVVQGMNCREAAALTSDLAAPHGLAT